MRVGEARTLVRVTLAAFALSMLVGASTPCSAEGEDLGKVLAAAVDLPTPQLRLAEAVKLSARADVTIDQWLAAMRGFGAFERAPPGPRTDKVPLQVGDVQEQTSIAVFVPQGYVPGKSAPLLLAFHGAGGEGHDENELWQAAADDLGMVIVGPTDPTANLGYQYTEPERARALAALRWARRTFDVDENRVYLTGVSRGGHLAWDLALRHPDQFAALVPMIGGPRLQIAKGQNNLRYLENLAHMAIRDLQGSKDDVRLLDNLKLAFKRLSEFGAKNAKLVLCPDMGHDFNPHAIDWKEFLSSARREPMPLRVVRSTARLDEARSFWVEATRFWPSVDEKFRADVEKKKWEAMDDDGRRLWAQDEADKRTARLEVRLTGPGAFTAKAALVQRFRLLLSQDMFDPAAPVEVTLNEKLTRYEVKPSKQVLLREFVERFDRTFLPIAEVSCP